MTDDQFREFMALLKQQHAVTYEVLGKSLATLGEINYYARMAAEAGQQQQQAEANEADPDKKETEAEAAFYIVRKEADGKLGLILYPASSLLKQSGGKVHSEDMHKIQAVVDIDLNEPYWAQKTTPDKDQLAEMKTEYLRPLGGTLRYVRSYRPPTGTKELPTKPFNRVISWTPDAPPVQRQSKPAAAQAPAQAAKAPAPAPAAAEEDHPFSDAYSSANKAPAQNGETDAQKLAKLVQDARHRYRLSVTAALGTSNEAIVNSAMEEIATQWGTMIVPPIAIEGINTLTNNALDAISEHVDKFPRKWKAWHAQQHPTVL